MSNQLPLLCYLRYFLAWVHNDVHDLLRSLDYGKLRLLALSLSDTFCQPRSDQQLCTCSCTQFPPLPSVHSTARHTVPTVRSVCARSGVCWTCTNPLYMQQQQQQKLRPKRRINLTALRCFCWCFVNYRHHSRVKLSISFRDGLSRV